MRPAGGIARGGSTASSSSSAASAVQWAEAMEQLATAAAVAPADQPAAAEKLVAGVRTVLQAAARTTMGATGAPGLAGLVSPSSMAAPDPAAVAQLTALAHRASHVFRQPPLTQVLLTWLSASASTTTAAPTPATSPTAAPRKKSPLLCLLAVSLLDAAYRSLPAGQPWPVAFVRVALEDFFDARTWVEHEGAAHFMKNITLAFNDWTDASANGEHSATGTTATLQPSNSKSTLLGPSPASVLPRYHTPALSAEVRSLVESAFAKACKDAYQHASMHSRTAPPPPPLHLLRFLSMSLGYRSLRHFCALNIEAWLNHAATNRAAKRLLVLLCDEIGQACSLDPASPTPPGPGALAALNHVNILLVPSKSPWSDLSANLPQVTPVVLASWSQSALGTSSTSNVDLQSVRLLVQLGMRVRSGSNQVLTHANWDEAYVEGMSRLLRVTSTTAPSESAGRHASASAALLPSVLLPLATTLHPSVWRLFLHSWLLCDWSTSVSMHGWSQGVNATATSASSAAGGAAGPPSLASPPPSTPPLLYSPTHLVLRVLDLVLRGVPNANADPGGTGGGLSDHLASYACLILDKTECVQRLRFVLRRAAWFNAMQVQQDRQGQTWTHVQESAGADAPAVNSRPFGAAHLDLFAFAARLLQPPPNGSSLTLRDPQLTDEMGRPVSAADTQAALLQSHAAELARVQAKREAAITEVGSLVTWACLLSAQICVLLQTNTTQALTAIVTPPSSSAALAASAPPRRVVTADSALRDWRFGIAGIQTQAMAWLQTWLVPALTATADAAPAIATAEAAPTGTAQPKDANTIFSESLTVLLFLQTSHQQLLQPFTAGSVFLSDLWTLDHSFLRKAASLLLDKLPLQEECITRLVMLSLAHPSKLPHAHTIQIIELLLRRVCLLALAMGRTCDHGLLRITNDRLLESILQLSQFHTPIPPPVTASSGPHPPLLAQSALFWRSCILLVIMAAFNPHTIGRRSWEQVPTLRCLLEMVVSEIWLTNGNGSGGSSSVPLSNCFPPFPDLISKSLLNHKVGVEIDAILFVENLLPDNRAGTGTPRTKETSLYLSHNYLMLLDPSEILRRPPEHILQTLQKLVADFQLGSYLRSSDSSHGSSLFLSNMLLRQTPEQYVAWTRCLVLADPTTIEHLPTAALAELMVHTTEKALFEPCRSVLNGATGEERENTLQQRRKSRCISTSLSRQPSLNGVPLSTHPATTAGGDPILDHLPAMIAVLRRLLPTVAAMYSGSSEGDAASSSGGSSIMAVMSPVLAASSAVLSPSSPLPALTPLTPPSSFNHVAFLDLLSMLLSRINSRSTTVRQTAAHALHLWLCPHPLPTSLAGPSQCGSCEDASNGGDLSSGTTPPLPPATCWLRFFFFSWFLHAHSEGASSSAVPSSPALSPAFLSAGRLIVRKVCTSLMCALEVENRPDTLFGYISFLHATATRFSYAPSMPPSKLFCLDLALRVCDVVLAREIIADKLLAPLLPCTKPARSCENDKKRKLDHLRSSPTGSPSNAMVIDASSDALPDLDLGGSSLLQLRPLDSTVASSDASSSPSLGSASCSAMELDDTRAVFSGYALVVSVLSSAFGVVEQMQGDDKFIKRMLLREQKRSSRAQHLSHAASANMAIPDSLPSTPHKMTPKLKRSRSQADDEEMDEEDMLDGAASNHGATPTPIDLLRRGSTANEDMLPEDSSVHTEPIEEEFVSLHRKWILDASGEICPLTHVPLPLLHGIISFLAYPYALPDPLPTSSAAISAPLRHYRHLLSILLPSSLDGPHAVRHDPSSTAPSLTIKSDASWVEDHVGIKWPIPSELQAERFLERSATPMLLLLAIEVCSPNQILAAISHFGLDEALVKRMLIKTDAWASYQIRLMQRQSTNAGGLPKSDVAMSPAMRELIAHRAKIAQFVQLYQVTLARPHTNGDVAPMDVDNGSSAVDTADAAPGDVLLSYLRSLPSSTDDTADAPATTAPLSSLLPEAAVNSSSSTHLSSLQRLLSWAPTLSLSFDEFASLQQLSPAAFCTALRTSFDGAHSNLEAVLPLLQAVVDGPTSETPALLDLLRHMHEATNDPAVAEQEGIEHTRAIIDELRSGCALRAELQT